MLDNEKNILDLWDDFKKEKNVNSQPLNETPKRIYIVIVNNKFNAQKVSQECYLTLNDAQKFITNRYDKPIKVNEFTFKSESNLYLIEELSVYETINK